jgi:TPP-dependent pyruvate/acetoin dehydrogenase alpha subunit
MLEHGSAIEGRPASFGVPTETVDGNDVRAVRSLTEKTVAQMRATPGPRCLLLHTYRLGPHSKGDDHRRPEEIAAHRANDPIKRAEADLAESLIANIQTCCQAHIKNLLIHFSLL